MKHLKTYEKSIINYYIPKKYFIASFFNVLGVYEVSNINKRTDTANIKLVYIYNNVSIKRQDSLDEYRKSLVVIENRTLYQSDDLQDCLDMLPILSDENKYNL